MGADCTCLDLNYFGYEQFIINILNTIIITIIITVRSFLRNSATSFQHIFNVMSSRKKADNLSNKKL